MAEDRSHSQSRSSDSSPLLGKISMAANLCVCVVAIIYSFVYLIIIESSLHILAHSCSVSRALQSHQTDTVEH